jgi:hypothetical protein
MAWLYHARNVQVKLVCCFKPVYNLFLIILECCKFARRETYDYYRWFTDNNADNKVKVIK